MDTLRFIINTTADAFATWLKANWRPPMACNLYLQPLREKRLQRNSAEVRSLAADAAFVVGQPEQETAYFLRDYIRFVLLPLAHDRLEVQIDFSKRAGKEWDYIAEVLEDIGLRWPETKSSLQDGKTHDAIVMVEADDTDARLRELWKNESLSIDDIAQELAYSPDQVTRRAYRLRLPERKRGRKKKMP